MFKHVWTLSEADESPASRTLGLFSSPLMAMGFISLPVGCFWEALSHDDNFYQITMPIPVGEYPDEMICLVMDECKTFYLSKTLIDPPPADRILSSCCYASR